MKITSEKMEKLLLMDAELNKVSKLVNEQVKTIQDRNGSNEVELERDGKTIKLTEKILWQEMYYLGFDSQSGKKLQELYPEEFKNILTDKKLADEMKEFVRENFGLVWTELTFTKLVQLVRDLIDYELSQPKEVTNAE